MLRKLDLTGVEGGAVRTAEGVAKAECGANGVGSIAFAPSRSVTMSFFSDDDAEATFLGTSTVDAPIAADPEGMLNTGTGPEMSRPLRRKELRGVNLCAVAAGSCALTVFEGAAAGGSDPIGSGGLMDSEEGAVPRGCAIPETAGNAIVAGAALKEAAVAADAAGKADPNKPGAAGAVDAAAVPNGLLNEKGVEGKLDEAVAD